MPEFRYAVPDAGNDVQLRHRHDHLLRPNGGLERPEHRARFEQNLFPANPARLRLHGAGAGARHSRGHLPDTGRYGGLPRHDPVIQRFQPAAGRPEDLFLVCHNGCDSTVLVNVLPKDTFATAQNLTICNGESALIFGQQQSTSGTYRMTFPAVNGCDSTHTVQLNVLPPLFLTLDDTPTCGGETEGIVADHRQRHSATNTSGTCPGDRRHRSTAGNSVTLTDLADYFKTASAQVVSYRLSCSTWRPIRCAATAKATAPFS